MSLSAGGRLGPYEILALIGAGGMGEVYRAKDTRLKREVALKVLPGSFANDPERMALFQREAEVLASLNHPNIAHIYGVEDCALVMELVEGETLKGPLPIETSLHYAKQIAEALEAAHEKGIVHRDLKPSNVKVTPEGVVKVLDFGLAMAVDGPAPTGDANISPTLTMRATQAGMIMGTAAYMSPEQARAQAVDRRADIWAFGAVLFEMLSGKQAFQGESVTDILASVVKLEPDWTALPASTPPAIVTLIQRCLTKERKQRLQAIGEARITIEKYLADPRSGNEASQQSEGRRTSRLPWAIGVAALMLIGIAGWAAWWRATRVVEQALKPLVRLTVDLGPDVSFGSGTGSGASVIISPDGTRLVYASQSRLFTRRLDQPNAAELAGTDGAFAPFFSPDGQWVAFFAPGKLKKVSVEGGSAVTLCNAANARGGSWGEDGNIIALSSVSGLSRIPAAGGPPTTVTELEPGESAHSWPQILPGGKAVLFTVSTTRSEWDSAEIEVVFLADRRREKLHRGGTYGRYLPSGHLVYVSQGTLFAAPLDLQTWALHGTPSPVLEQVTYNVRTGFAEFDFSRTGTLVYRSGGTAGGLVTVQWLDGAGKMQPLLAKPGFYQRPRLSPDGRRLAMGAMVGSAEDIWVYELQRDTMTRLTFSGGNTSPVWSSDGRYIAFQGKGGMFWTRADGAGTPQVLTHSKNLQFPSSFTPDDKRLAFNEYGDLNTIWTLPLESDGARLRAESPEIFLRTPFDQRHGYFSPDVRWLAYSSDESGTYEVYVRAFPDRSGRWQVSNAGGVYPVFSRNGHDLFFRTEDNRIMVASYTANGNSFAVEKPRMWSEKRLANLGGFIANYDVAPDGKRVAALMPADTPEDQKAQNQVIFLENFLDELRRRVPVTK